MWALPAAITSLFLLSGCAYMAPQDDLKLRVPGSWAVVSQGNEKKISSGWLNEFSDAEMKRSVREALAHNQSLRSAAARLRQATEETIIVRARQLPNLGTGVSGGVSDGPSQARSQNYGVNLAASWEVDLWGRLRDLTRAAEADERAAIEDFRGARLSLAANTAKAYTDLASTEQEVTLADDTLVSFQKNLRVIERNYKATGEGALDIQFARTNVSSAQRTLEVQKQNREDAARALEVLQGKYPVGNTRGARALPKLPSNVPAGIPASLIERRPDLAAARARLLASAKRADAARKDLLPGFSLTARSGNASGRFSDLLRTDFLLTTIGANIDQFVYDGGAREARSRSSLAANERALADYVQIALEAFSEVEATLSAERSLAKQEGFLENETKQAVLAERQAERNYAEGINPNILSVLEAQRRANNARAAIIRLRNRRLQNRFDLHLALGGDFATAAR